MRAAPAKGQNDVLHKMMKSNVKTWLSISALLVIAYPALYIGVRASDLLVRRPEHCNIHGRPARDSNLIISCRGFILKQLVGDACWLVFFPAHKTEIWYRNRPRYFFRRAIERQKQEEKMQNKALHRTAESRASAAPSVR